MLQTSIVLRERSRSPIERQDFRKEIIKLVSEDGNGLRNLPDKFCRDRGIVLAAVRQNGKALKYASAELRADIDVVTAALCQNIEVKEWANNSLDLTETINTISHLMINGFSLKYKSLVFQNNFDVVLTAVRQTGVALEYASTELRADKDVVLAAVRQDGYALKHASEALRSDIDVIIEARRTKPDAGIYSTMYRRHNIQPNIFQSAELAS